MGIYIASSLLAGVLVSLGLHETEATIPHEQGSPATRSAAEAVAEVQTARISAPLPIPGQIAGHTPDAGEPPSAPVSLLQAEPSVPSTAEPVTREQPADDAPPTADVDAQEAASGEATALADTAAQTEPVSAEPLEIWKKHVVASGETLSGIFEQFKLSASTLYRVTHASKDAAMLARIRPGQELAFLIDSEGNLDQLVFKKTPVETLRVQKDEEGFTAQLERKEVEHKVASVTGTIGSSLFVDGQKAGLTDAQIMELAEIFGWDIDFALEIRSGDQFRVVYEEQFIDGKKYRNGPILAAEFVNQGKTYQAFRFEAKDRISYYDADGHSKRRAFIRTPIKFARISSRFTPRRWHPILKKWKSHKGVDYACPTGTPIKVTGSGRVVFRGWQRGYGRVVIVQHNTRYKTVYAHMSKFRSNVKQGTRVQQGQVIGYVGHSGWATGPHLHYEFRVNNVQRNPLTVKLPKSLPLPKKQLAAFKREIAPLTRKLASIRQATMVASADR